LLEIVYLLHADYGKLSDAISFFSKVSSLTRDLRTEISFTCLAKGFLNDEFGTVNTDFTIVHVPNIGRDIYSYMYISTKSRSDFLMFFNTSSKVCSVDFFSSAMEQLGRHNCGAISATGSSGSIISNKYFLDLARLTESQSFLVGASKSLLARVGEFGVRACGYRPVPHLRTNAFGISREKFTSLIKMVQKVPKSRFESLRFESGEMGMSSLLRRNGQSILVMDKFGQDYNVNRWLSSRTYCSHGQSSLAVTDNRTAEYHEGDLHMKRKLFIGAWCNTDYFDLNIKRNSQLDRHL